MTRSDFLATAVASTPPGRSAALGFTFHPNLGQWACAQRGWERPSHGSRHRRLSVPPNCNGGVVVRIRETEPDKPRD
jgi:hypothetical protein